MSSLVFYSWQSDSPSNTNRYFIQEALDNAIKAIRDDESIKIWPVMDRDTANVPGAPDIVSTIFSKIDQCEVFVCDISIITSPRAKRPSPNPNVLIELGYALKKLGPDRVIMVLNKASGDQSSLPFDLRTKRALAYELKEGQEKAPVRKVLTRQLENALRLIFEKIQPQRDSKTRPTSVDIVRKFLDESSNRFQELCTSREELLPKHGSWEVAFVIFGNIAKYSPNLTFLNLIALNNPELSGWPLWVDSRRFKGEDVEPRVFGGAWEAFVVLRNVSRNPDHIDYWRIDPNGYFYHHRALEDDLELGPRGPEPLTVLDFLITIYNVTEALVTGVAFARAMGGEQSDCTLAFCFRWRGIRDRQLSSWADPARIIRPSFVSYQDEVLSEVVVSLNIPNSELFQKVHEAIKPLFESFGGFEMPIEVTKSLVQEKVGRGLSL